MILRNTIRMIGEVIKTNSKSIDVLDRIKQIISLYNIEKKWEDSKVNGQIINFFLSAHKIMELEILQLLKPTNELKIRRNLIFIIGESNDCFNFKIAEVLLKFLEDNNETEIIRGESAISLAKKRYTKVVDSLVNCSKIVNSRFVRKSSIYALGELKAEKGYQTIIDSLNDDIEEIKTEAIFAFSKFDNASNDFMKLIAILNEKNEKDNVKLAVIEVLEELNVCNSISFVIDKLKIQESTQIQIACLNLIAKLYNTNCENITDALPIINYIRKNSNDLKLRNKALETLNTICDKSDFKECVDIIQVGTLSKRDGFAIVGIIFSLISIIAFGIYELSEHTQRSNWIFSGIIGSLALVIIIFIVYYVAKDLCKSLPLRKKYRKSN